jgi:hypothetical protein
MKYLFAIITALIMSNIVYRIYITITDYKFTLAFLGGAITLIIVLSIINGKKLFAN